MKDDSKGQAKTLVKREGARSLSEMLAVFAERGQQKQDEPAQGEPTAPSEPQTATVIQLPLWAEAVRRMPNELLRSALFSARNRKQPRAYLKNADIAVLFDGCITYLGEELRQDDETVWLQLIHLAKEQPVGSVVEFTPYSFCKAIQWPICKASYQRLRDCLGRMQATSLSVYSKRLGEGVSLSMIPKFSWHDENKQTLKKYRVQVAAELVKLFDGGHYSQLEWAQRLALPVGIATWLHGYYASHREPYPVKLETLKRGAGITTSSPARLRQLIEAALAELVAAGFLESWEIKGDLVCVKRAQAEKGQG